MKILIRNCRFYLFSLLLTIGLTANATPTIESWQTSQGMRVYFVANNALPMIDIRLVFAAGSAYETNPKLAGIASFTNQLLDQGTKQLNADQLAQQFEQQGAIFSTGSLREMAWLQLRTLSYTKQRQAVLPLFIQVLKQAKFSPDSMAYIRKQMLQDLQGTEESPSQLVKRQFFQTLYKHHPYANDPEGNKSSLSKIQRQDIIEFYQQYYVANNAVLAIVGDLSLTQAKQISEQISKAMPQGQTAPIIPEVSSSKQQQTVIIDYPSSQTHIMMGLPLLSRTDPDYFPLYVGNHILGGSGLTSMLSKEVREKHGLAYSIYSSFSPMSAQGPFFIKLQTRNSQQAKARALILQTLKQFIQQGPTAEQLSKSKKNLTGSMALRIDSNKKIVEYLAMIGFYQLPLDYLATLNAKIQAVTLEQIHQAFQRVNLKQLHTILVGFKHQKSTD